MESERIQSSVKGKDSEGRKSHVRFRHLSAEWSYGQELVKRVWNPETGRIRIRQVRLNSL